MKGKGFSKDLKDFYDFAFMTMPTEKFIEFETMFYQFIKKTLDDKVENLMYGKRIIDPESLREIRSIVNEN